MKLSPASWEYAPSTKVEAPESLAWLMCPITELIIKCWNQLARDESAQCTVKGENREEDKREKKGERLMWQDDGAPACWQMWSFSLAYRSGAVSTVRSVMWYFFSESSFWASFTCFVAAVPVTKQHVRWRQGMTLSVRLLTERSLVAVGLKLKTRMLEQRKPRPNLKNVANGKGISRAGLVPWRRETKCKHSAWRIGMVSYFGGTINPRGELGSTVGCHCNSGSMLYILHQLKLIKWWELSKLSVYLVISWNSSRRRFSHLNISSGVFILESQLYK